MEWNEPKLFTVWGLGEVEGGEILLPILSILILHYLWSFVSSTPFLESLSSFCEYHYSISFILLSDEKLISD